MKFRRHKLLKTYHQVHKTGRKHLHRRPYLLPVFGLVLGVVIVGVVLLSYRGHSLQPSNSHVVFLYDKETRQTLDTRAATVGELLAKLPLNLQPQDVVEPAKNTPIVEDNFRVNIYRARPVTIIDKGMKTVTLTAQKSPRVVATSAGVKVYPEDIVNFTPGSIKENIIGEKVTIDRATPVTLNLYGTSLAIRVQAKTVSGLLTEKEIKLAKGDTVLPKSSTPIKPNMLIFVLRKGVKIVSITQEIPAPTQSVSDPSLTHGTTAIRQQGSPGKEVVTYQITSKDGREISRKIMQRVITMKPVPKIIAVGSEAFSGSLQDWLYKLRMCESHGNYQTNTSNGYYGAYQFGAGTWSSLNTGYTRADLAPPAVQDQAIIINTNRSSGGLASQNPGCQASQGLSTFPPSNR